MLETWDIAQYHFFKKLCDHPKIQKIWLYDSRARGDAQMRSDIDLAISCPDCTKKEWFEILDIIGDADTLLRIDCVRLEDLSDQDPLRINILHLNKVISLYDK